VSRCAGKLGCTIGTQSIVLLLTSHSPSQGSQRPCVPPSRRGSFLLAAVVRPPGIIVAIGLMHRCVTPESTPWRLIGRRNGRKTFFCGVSEDSELPKLDADFSRVRASGRIGYLHFATHPRPLIRELTLRDAVTKVNGAAMHRPPCSLDQPCEVSRHKVIYVVIVAVVYAVHVV
jgi:hypothetical protein